jgi:hypothetical protein
MSLLELTLWITGSRLRYQTYTGPFDFIFELDEESRMNFVLFVWHSEGCPDIGEVK